MVAERRRRLPVSPRGGGGPECARRSTARHPGAAIAPGLRVRSAGRPDRLPRGGHADRNRSLRGASPASRTVAAFTRPAPAPMNGRPGPRDPAPSRTFTSALSSVYSRTVARPRRSRRAPHRCRDGGTGRRAGLKIQYWKQCASSSLAPGTILPRRRAASPRAESALVRHIRYVSISLFFQPGRPGSAGAGTRRPDVPCAAAPPPGIAQNDSGFR